MDAVTSSPSQHSPQTPDMPQSECSSPEPKDLEPKIKIDPATLSREVSDADYRPSSSNQGGQDGYREVSSSSPNTFLTSPGKFTAPEPPLLSPKTPARAISGTASPILRCLSTTPKVGILYDQSMEEHAGPRRHVECPARTATLFARLKADKLLEKCVRLEARQATHEEILRGHTLEHITAIEEDSKPGWLDLYHQSGDMYYCASTATAARMATGCCIEAVQAVCRGVVTRAMAVVRPPGHHAECDRAMGFCFFNNVALAALAALQEPGIKRVAVLDWDVHHGNGIQNILYNNADALYISIHRGPPDFYPFNTGYPEEVGQGPGQGYNVNIPWSDKGMGDCDYEAAMELLVEPVLAAFKPDMLIVSAGFDAAEGDPLGGCCITAAGYASMTRRLLQFADGRLVMALEGGYNLRVTAECACACVSVLLGNPPPAMQGKKAHQFESCTNVDLQTVVSNQQQYWPSLSVEAFDLQWSALSLSHEMALLNVKQEQVEDFMVTHKAGDSAGKQKKP